MASSKMGNLTDPEWPIVVSGVRVTTSNRSSISCGRYYVLNQGEDGVRRQD